MHHVPIDRRQDSFPHRDGLAALFWTVLSAVISCAAASVPKLFGASHNNTPR